MTISVFIHLLILTFYKIHINVIFLDFELNLFSSPSIV